MEVEGRSTELSCQSAKHMHIAPAQVLPILPQRGGWAVVSASKDEDRELRALLSTIAGTLWHPCRVPVPVPGSVAGR